jgi:hypothetical protein
MVNNVIAVVNYVIAARPSPLNYVIADSNRCSSARGTRGLTYRTSADDRNCRSAL